MTRATRSLGMTRLLALALLVVGTSAFVGAHFADPQQVQRLFRTGKCPGCDLQDANLSGLTAMNGDLKGADLRGAKAYKANLRFADLTNANLTGTDFTGADLKKTIGAQLAGATTDTTTTCPDGTAGPCR